MKKKSFVLTGYVQRSTCNCGCISHNTFWQDGGFGGCSSLSHLHKGIEKFLDELSGAGPGGTGKSADVKVTITVEELGDHDHRILDRGSFSGLGSEDNQDLKKLILQPSEPTVAEELRGDEQFWTEKEKNKAVANLNRDLSVCFIQDVYDRLLLVERTGDLSKLADLRDSLQAVIERED